MLYGFAALIFFPPRFCPGHILWNHYSQRLQIECAAWSCSLILHCCLPSQFAFLFFFYFFYFFPPRFCPGHISGTVTRRDSKLSVLLGSCGLILHCCLPSNSLRYFLFIFFFRHDFVRAISLEPLLAETPN